MQIEPKKDLFRNASWICMMLLLQLLSWCPTDTHKKRDELFGKDHLINCKIDETHFDTSMKLLPF